MQSICQLFMILSAVDVIISTELNGNSKYLAHVELSVMLTSTINLNTIRIKV